MNSERRRQVKEIFRLAIQRLPEERAEFLSTACGSDETLQREIESLIAAHEEENSFSDTAAYDPAADIWAQNELKYGDVVANYQIVTTLGKGGMGEVYVARDTKLDRNVALKLLPTAFTGNRERLSRFVQEAKAAAATNHPNIAHIYEIGEHNGARFITMEFIEGISLRERLRQAPVKTAEALDITVQIASALSAAHEAGIIHRDIKPENVMLRRDGIVKLLDFGLAKLSERRTTEASAEAPTIAKLHTSPGVVMGTVNYMSPEQARGLLVDERTDIFSLGVVLYEMISGRVPFGGETASDVIAAILQNEPPPLPREEPAVPAELQWIVSKALRKAPDERYQTAKELLGDIRNLKEDFQLQARLKRFATPELVSKSVAESASQQDAHARSALVKAHLFDLINQHKSALVLTLALMSVVIAVVGYLVFSNNKKSQNKALTTQLKLERLTFSPGLQSEPTWSPDGRFIAYSSNQVGNFDIYVQPVSEGNPVQVTHSPAHDWQPDWSPDGSRIVFRSEREGGGLFVVSALGGNERKISNFGYRPRWSPNGSQILFYGFHIFPNEPGTNVDNPTVYLVGLDGQPPRQVLPESTAEFFRSRVAWHPDGQRVSIWGNHHKFGLSLWTAPITGGTSTKSEISVQLERQLQEAAVDFEDFQWAPSGRAIYFEGTSQGVRNVWKVEVDPQTLRWIAGPERLTTGPGDDTDITVSRDGKRLALTTRVENTRIWSLPFNSRTGRAMATGTPVTPAGVNVWVNGLSPDGKKFVYVVRKAQKQELWEKSLEDGRETLLMPADDFERDIPIWSSDGLRLVYQRFRATNPGRSSFESAVVMLPDGGGEEQMLTSTVAAFVYPGDWSADGESMLAGTDLRTPGHYLICRLPLRAVPRAETQMQVIVSDPEYGVFQPRFSPDGRWISFNAFKPGEQISTINIVPAAGGDWTRISEGKYWDDKPRWAPDGKTIYFVSNRGVFFNVWGIRFDSSAGKPVGEPFRVSSFENPAQMVSPRMAQMELSLAADRILLPITEASGNVWVLENVDR